MTTKVSESAGTAEAPEEVSAGKVARSAIWAGFNNIATRFANIAITATVARLLSPEDFGVFAVALAVHTIVTTLAELGMASAIARSPMEPEDIAGTVTTISIFTSFGLAAIMALGAHPLAAMFGTPQAAGPIRILAISLALTGLFAVAGAQLSREFRQDRVFFAQGTAFIPANALLILLAASTGGAAAFAWSRVLGQLVAGVIYMFSVSRVYWPQWRPRLVGPLLRFGLPLALANLVTGTLLNADYLILGHFVSEARIGVYMIAFTVANWSTVVLGSILNGVVVPSFGRVAGNLVRLRRLLVVSGGLVALVAMPIGAVSVALSHDIITVVFGSQWLGAGSVLRILAIYGVLFAFSLLLSNVMVAVGATTRLLAVQLVWVVVLIPAMVVGVKHAGLIGAAWAHVVVIVAVAIPSYLVAMRGAIGGLPEGWIRPMLRPAFAASVAASVGYLISYTVSSPFWGLILGGLLSVVTYAWIAWPAILAAAPQTVRVQRWLLRRRPPEKYRLAVVLEGLALGGCPINAIDLSRTLRDRGHQIDIFAVDEQVNVSLLPYAEAAGFAVTTFAAGTNSCERSAAMRAAFDGRRYDVIHSYAPWLGPATTLACGRGARPAPVVLNWNMEHMPRVSPRIPLIMGTEKLCDAARAEHGGRVWLLEPPVDTEHDRPDLAAGRGFRADYGIADDQLLLVLVGRVDRVMKLPAILAAIGAVEVLADPSIRLAIVGDGNASDEVRAEVERVNTALGWTAIVMTGLLRDPRPAYAAADIALAMGGSALRALAHGAPVIVQGDRGFADVCEPSTEEYFFREGMFGEEVVPEPAAHLAGLIARLRDGEERQRLADYGPRLIANRFSLMAGADRLEEIYAHAIEARPGPLGRLVDLGRIVTRERARRAFRRAGTVGRET